VDIPVEFPGAYLSVRDVGMASVTPIPVRTSVTAKKNANDA
jgi:hypothetical protein